MLKRTDGIVLKSTVFGEADLIVTYLTSDYGLLKAFAKSPRKIRSRFGSSLEPLTYAKISVLGKEESNLPRLTQSDIIRPFYSLREDFTCLLNISEILELNLNFLPEKEPHPEIFKLLLNILAKLEANSSNRLYYLYYKIRFLEITGYSPRLDACGRCGASVEYGETEKRRNGESEKQKNKGFDSGSPAPRLSDSPAHHNFYVSHGSIICRKCTAEGDEPIRLSTSALRFYRSLLKWSSAAIDRIIPPEALLSEIEGVINSHTRHVLGPPRSSYTAIRKNTSGITS
jgi:DNA repair protein RecO (recombination protein O)